MNSQAEVENVIEEDVELIIDDFYVFKTSEDSEWNLGYLMANHQYFLRDLKSQDHYLYKLHSYKHIYQHNEEQEKRRREDVLG